MSIETTTIEAGHLTPRITLSLDDYERLSALAKTAMAGTPGLAEILTGELARAHVLAAGRCPQDEVIMNSEVTFRDDRTGRLQSMRLVYPRESDVAKSRLSVLTPVGAALIGVRVGESVTWETPSGELRQLTVISVKDP